MPSMTIHRVDIETTKVNYTKSIPGDIGWITFSQPETGDYLTIYLDSEERSFKVLLELEAAIQKSLAHLVSLRMEEKEESE